MRSVNLLTAATQREQIAGLWDRFSAAFPKTSQLLKARLTTQHFSGLILTLIVLVMLYLLGLFGGLVEELLEAEELVNVDYWINEQLALIRTDSML
ncbi:MAG: hypothetical protein R3341_01740, partial [Methylophaga sp.]|nr:hypothetical protein [Methylophaga sp.]